MASGYNLGTASGRIVVDGSGAAKGFEVARSAGQKFFEYVQNQTNQLEEFGQNLRRGAAVAGVGFGIAVTAAAKYEARLSAIEAVSGATEQQMERVSQAALKIGSRTSFSATEAAMAFEELIKAGISVDDALDGAADAVANLAEAGEISLPRAAEIASAAMNNFNLAGRDMPKVADLVAGAANASAISVGEFASSMQQVGAVANLTGLSFKDTSVAIAEMGNAGIKASDAGTSLKTMLMNLVPTTDRQIEKFKELGLLTTSNQKAMAALERAGIQPLGSSFEDIRASVADYLSESQGLSKGTDAMKAAVDRWLVSSGAMNNQFFDRQGNIKSLAEIQEVLQNSTKDMTKEQQLATLELLFGADAIRGAAVMAKEGAEGYNEMAAAMGKVTAADVAAKRMDNLAGSIEEMKGALETAAIRIGSVLIPVLDSLVDGVTAVINWFNGLSDTAVAIITWVGVAAAALAGLVGILIAVAAAIGPLLFSLVLLGKGLAVFSAVKAAFAGVSSVLGVFKALGTLVMGAVKALSPLLMWVLRIGGAFRLLGVAITVLSGPVGWIIGAIAALVAAGIALYNNWKPFRDLVDSVAAAISGFFSAAIQKAKALLDQLAAGFLGVGQKGSGIAGFFYDIGNGARILWTALQELWGVIKSNLLPALQELWGTVSGAFMAAWKELSTVVMNELWPALQKLWSSITSQLLPALVSMWSAFGPIVGTILKVAGIIVGVLIMGLIKLVTFILGTVLPAILQFAGPVLGFLITAIGKIASFIVQYLITPFIQFVTFLFGTVIPAIFRFGESLITGIVGAFKQVVSFVTTVWTAITTFFTNLVTGAQNAGTGATNGIRGFVDAVVGFFAGLIGHVISFAQQVGQWLGNLFQPLITGVQMVIAFVAPILMGLWNIFSTIFMAIYGVVAAAVRLIFAIVNFIFNAIVIAIRVALNIVRNIVTTVWNAVAGFITAVLNRIRAIITTVWNAIVTVVTAVLNRIWAIISAIWNRIVGFLAPILQRIWSVISSVWNRVWSVINSVLNRIWSVISSVWNRIIATITSILNRIWSVISSIWNKISGFISGIIDTISSVITSTWESIRSSVANALQGMYDAAVEKFAAVLDYVGGIKDKILGFFSGAAGWLLDAGANIIQGLIDGITGALGGLEGMLNDITSKIPDWKGPPERDKKLLTEAGRMIMSSLNQGLKDNIGEVYETLSGMNMTIPATVSAVNAPSSMEAAMVAARGPVNSSNVKQATPAPREGDQYNINVTAEDGDSAQDIVEKMMFEIKKTKRGGKKEPN